jgi:alpha(1,3/1,4) fucosyltransferase
MIIGSIFQDGHSNNSMFSLDDSVHRYNPTYTPRVLRNKLLDLGVEINTPDINSGRDVAFELHVEGRPLGAATIPRYLLALENPYINLMNNDREYLRQFNKVFTWNKKFFDMQNVTPVYVPNKIAWESFEPFENRNIFSCLINANKGFPCAIETDLYQERLRVIRWYEKNAPDDFSLYGMGWQKPARGFGMIDSVKRRVGRLRTQLYGYKPFPSYKGEVRLKSDVMKRCKFSYCYENVRDLPNYVTEKIFDSLLAGCVPVYLGANNIGELIPDNCYIDRRQFVDTAEVHAYLQSVDAYRYAEYQEAILAFLNGESARRFSAESLAEIVGASIAANLSPHHL